MTRASWHRTNMIWGGCPRDCMLGVMWRGGQWWGTGSWWRICMVTTGATTKHLPTQPGQAFHWFLIKLKGLLPSNNALSVISYHCWRLWLRECYCLQCVSLSVFQFEIFSLCLWIVNTFNLILLFWINVTEDCWPLLTSHMALLICSNICWLIECGQSSLSSVFSVFSAFSVQMCCSTVVSSPPHNTSVFHCLMSSAAPTISSDTMMIWLSDVLWSSSEASCDRQVCDCHILSHLINSDKSDISDIVIRKWHKLSS